MSALAKHSAEAQVKTFCVLVQRGIDSWTEAGKLLWKMKQDDPQVFGKIISANPNINTLVLLQFERIGKGEIYPPLLLDGSLGARKLLTLPIEKQRELCGAEIEAVTWKEGEIIVVKRKLCELSGRETETVFAENYVRSIEEQRKYLRPKGTVREMATPTKFIQEKAEAEEEDQGYRAPEIEVFKGAKTAIGELNLAQNALLRARNLLTEKERVHDRYLAAALTAVGLMRQKLQPED